jgi:hypothetical protein
MTELAVHLDLLQQKIVLFILEFTFLFIHYFIPADLLLPRLIIGLISYIVLPGFLIVSYLKISRTFNETLIFTLLLGFSMLILFLTIIWSVHIDQTNLRLIIMITNAVIYTFLIIRVKVFQLHVQRSYLFLSFCLILLLAIFVRSYYFTINNESLGIDGGLYCDFARNIVNKGTFSSNIVNDGGINPYFNIKGFLDYPITVFSISSFFFIGNTSFDTAKLDVLFIGVLVVLLVYLVSKELFDEKVALIAGAISSFLPVLAYYSTILNGPEILSTLFILASCLFFNMGIKRDECKARNLSIAGMFVALTLGAWGISVYLPLLATLMLIFILNKFKDRALSIYFIFLICIIFLASKYSAILFIGLPFAFIPFLFLIILNLKRKSSKYMEVTLFSIATIVFLQIVFLHSYLAPEMYVAPTTLSFIKNPLQIINPVQLTYGISIDSAYLLTTINRFWDSIVVCMTPFIFGVAISSFIFLLKIKEKTTLLLFPLLCSILFALALPQYVAWYSDTFPDRFLIAPICFLIILSAVTLEKLLSFGSKSSLSFFIRGRNVHINHKAIFSILVIISIMSSLIWQSPAFLSRFDEGYVNTSKLYGGSFLNWINQNSSQNDVFLASDVRRLTWITDKVFVGTTTQSNILGITELANLINNFNVTYVVIDSFLINYTLHTKFVDSLYSDPTSIGESIPIADPNLSGGILTELALYSNHTLSINGYGLQLVFETSNPSPLRIYKVVHELTTTIATIFIENVFNNSWVQSPGCIFNSTGGLAQVTTSSDASWAYIYLNQSLNLNHTKLSNIAVKVKGDGTPSTNFWVALVDSAGVWHKVPSDTLVSDQFTLFTSSVPQNPMHALNNIFLGVSGGTQKSVEYAWVMIYNTTNTHILGAP